MTDPVKKLLKDANDARAALTEWLGFRMGEFVGELEEAGCELEDIPALLSDYAAWLKRNFGLFDGGPRP